MNPQQVMNTPQSNMNIPFNGGPGGGQMRPTNVPNQSQQIPPPPPSAQGQVSPMSVSLQQQQPPPPPQRWGGMSQNQPTQGPGNVRLELFFSYRGYFIYNTLFLFIRCKMNYSSSSPAPAPYGIGMGHHGPSPPAIISSPQDGNNDINFNMAKNVQTTNMQVID
jgi:hypothetical protein